MTNWFKIGVVNAIIGRPKKQQIVSSTNQTQYMIWCFLSANCCTACRNHFVNAPSQWETTLQCNVVCHWVDVYTRLDNVYSIYIPEYMRNQECYAAAPGHCWPPNWYNDDPGLHWIHTDMLFLVLPLVILFISSDVIPYPVIYIKFTGAVAIWSHDIAVLVKWMD